MGIASSKVQGAPPSPKAEGRLYDRDYVNSFTARGPCGMFLDVGALGVFFGVRTRTCRARGHRPPALGYALPVLLFTRHALLNQSSRQGSRGSRSAAHASLVTLCLVTWPRARVRARVRARRARVACGVRRARACQPWQVCRGGSPVPRQASDTSYFICFTSGFKRPAAPPAFPWSSSMGFAWRRSACHQRWRGHKCQNCRRSRSLGLLRVDLGCCTTAAFDPLV